MNASTIIALIGVVLTAVSLLGVLIGKLMKQTERLTKLQDEITDLVGDFEEYRASSKEKFRELYTFKEDTKATLVKVELNTQNILDMLKEMKDAKK